MCAYIAVCIKPMKRDSAYSQSIGGAENSLRHHVASCFTSKHDIAHHALGLISYSTEHFDDLLWAKRTIISGQYFVLNPTNP